jgi:N-methylhydantoinase A
MASAARVHVAEGGHEVEKFALLVTGGGGPLHGCDVARRLGINRVICPPGAGVASAVGLLIAPARIDRVRSIARQLRDIGVAELEAAFAALETDAARVMRETLGDDGAFSFERAADIRFVGQGFEIVTRLPGGPFDAATPGRIVGEFKDGYARIFAHVPPVDEVELINLRLAAFEQAVDRPLKLTGSGTEWSIGSDSRDVWDSAAATWRALKVIARDALEAGRELIGPIVIEDASSTLVIPEGARARRDASGNIIVDLEPTPVADGEAGRKMKQLQPSPLRLRRPAAEPRRAMGPVGVRGFIRP